MTYRFQCDECELAKENEQLKNRVDELEDDNMKYTLSTDKLEGYTKRFMPTKCINEFRDCKTNRYYWLDNEDNFTGTLELLNLLDCENEQLKEKIARQKFSKKIMRENIKNYERAIKRLRKSYNEFDEMRLDRIRFLEKRLKKHGLSIYVNGCEDLE